MVTENQTLKERIFAQDEQIRGLKRISGENELQKARLMETLSKVKQTE